MGSNQSSGAKDGYQSSSSKKSSGPLKSVRGRKSNTQILSKNTPNHDIYTTTTATTNTMNSNMKAIKTGTTTATNKTKRGSAPPHGLSASVVSSIPATPSEQYHLYSLTEDDHLDETSAMSVHSEEEEEEAVVAIRNLAVVVPEEEESETEDEETDDEEDDDDDEWWTERRCILQDARNLKRTAAFFLHPEAPMASTGSRCFFHRFAAAAATPTTKEADAERCLILADAAALQAVAAAYLHPELPVVVSATATGRNYFDRYLAPPSTTEAEEEERAAILRDTESLQRTAKDFRHPEIPMVATDGTACGRNFFARGSAPDYLSGEEEERNQILQDALALKLAAAAYMHPERPVSSVDPAVFGRNYFSRYSAPEYEELDNGRQEILSDALALKSLAKTFLHPEVPLLLTPEACGRNYFHRFSAPTSDESSMVEWKVRQQILQDAALFKQVARDYFHPELPVVIYATATGRNYYSRHSSDDDECYASLQDEEARNQIMSDLKLFKKLASDFLHPELPVVIFATETGQNFFSRFDAFGQESLEEAQERDLILADAKALQQAANDYMHPKYPVVSTDSTACGRNYFSRASAPDGLMMMEQDREAILADVQALKQAAVAFLHPEAPIATTDACICGRNYFSRPSTVVVEEAEQANERDLILSDLRALKKTAVDFMHPEIPVVTSDPTACARNYFSRYSAPVMSESSEELDDEEEERRQVLAESAALKKLALDYLHPEHSVVGAEACVRNYFNRPSCTQPEDAEAMRERDLILSELRTMKKTAVDFMHPEMPVVPSDPTACARSYFSRYSAPVLDPTKELEEDERRQVMADAVALKKLAMDYLHPELPVVSSVACARNYFSRYSSLMSDPTDELEEDERRQVLAESAALKKLALDYLHPEHSVVGAEACARNYFNRPSCTLHNQLIHTFPVHEDDWNEHHEHIDHFGMDEEMELFADLRKDLGCSPIDSVNRTKVHYADSDVGSNLSRSPSSVMLFGMDESSANYD